MTDSAFLLSILEDGKPHTTMEILNASISERGCGLTVHSRAADLREQGHYIACECVGKQNGRPVYEYTLLGSLSESPLSAAPPPLAGSPESGRGDSESEQPGLFELPGGRPAWA